MEQEHVLRRRNAAKTEFEAQIDLAVGRAIVKIAEERGVDTSIIEGDLRRGEVTREDLRKKMFDDPVFQAAVARLCSEMNS